MRKFWRSGRFGGGNSGMLLKRLARLPFRAIIEKEFVVFSRFLILQNSDFVKSFFVDLREKSVFWQECALNTLSQTQKGDCYAQRKCRTHGPSQYHFA
jgi:hypothetical protein